MFKFLEISSDIIFLMYNPSHFENARYFSITKNDKPVCIYGVIPRTDKVCEVLWIIPSFYENGFTKELFINMFEHFKSLGYEEAYTWTRCPKLSNILNHFKKLGVEKTECPDWDLDETKTWFKKRIEHVRK